MRYDIGNFETQIDEKSRSRGYDFYCEGRIKSIFNINGVEWMAVVQAYDDHVVQLRIENNTLTKWSCDCNDEEDVCRHVAAVLYFIRNEGGKLKKTDTTGYEEIKEQLSYLPPHVLRYLILKYAAGNNSFRSYLNEYLSGKKKP